ncbi:hypothetical protein CCACVL1_04014 [Corchorus capsularis]|uniref:TF-B3 domain-containing protein n=1 Tax=Corchorus capsularis TaxID=210143 RepID=A0A1R3JVM9_COCAP|nr:hypothetical protein CCACVL1_04014 [Corchorus capsularis]
MYRGIYRNQSSAPPNYGMESFDGCGGIRAALFPPPPSIYWRLERWIPPEVTLRDINGMTWQVKVVVRESDQQILLGRGWPTFYDAHYLQGCVYLLFRLVKDYVFEVSVFCDCGIEVVDFRSECCH